MSHEPGRPPLGVAKARPPAVFSVSPWGKPECRIHKKKATQPHHPRRARAGYADAGGKLRYNTDSRLKKGTFVDDHSQEDRTQKRCRRAQGRQDCRAAHIIPQGGHPSPSTTPQARPVLRARFDGRPQAGSSPDATSSSTQPGRKTTADARDLPSQRESLVVRTLRHEATASTSVPRLKPVGPDLIAPRRRLPTRCAFTDAT